MSLIIQVIDYIVIDQLLFPHHAAHSQKTSLSMLAYTSFLLPFTSLLLAPEMHPAPRTTARQSSMKISAILWNMLISSVRVNPTIYLVFYFLAFSSWVIRHVKNSTQDRWCWYELLPIKKHIFNVHRVFFLTTRNTVEGLRVNLEKLLQYLWCIQIFT